MELAGVKAGVDEDDLQGTGCGWVPLQGSFDIAPNAA
jgi:hypothetical protein